jgi:hypothetical protein
MGGEGIIICLTLTFGILYLLASLGLVLLINLNRCVLILEQPFQITQSYLLNTYSVLNFSLDYFIHRDCSPWK